MSERDLRNGDAGDDVLRNDVRGLLAARDRREHPPTFDSILSKATDSVEAQRRSTLRRFGPALAAGLVAVTIALVWTGRATRDDASVAALDPAVVEKLSSPDYWRVPSDVLLAQAPHTSAPELPQLPTFEMSLEESVL